MVDFSRKQTTRFLARNTKRDISSVPQREVKKRKSVRFEEPLNDDAVATSDFVSKENQEWTFVATCFNLPEEEQRNKSIGGEKELLVLCNYFDEGEKFQNFNEDSDEAVPFGIFAEQGRRVTWQQGESSSTVSTLRLTSLLRIESRRQDEHGKRSTNLFLDDNDNLDDAFQGRLSCTNNQNVSRSRKAPTLDKSKDFCSQISQEDFWSIVEF